VVGQVAAGAVALLSGLELVQHASGADLGLTAVICGAHPGATMAIATAVALGLAAVGLLTIGVEFPGGHQPSQILGFLTCLLGLVGLLGFGLGLDRLNEFPAYEDMAAATSMGLVALGFALLCVRPGTGVMTVVLDDGVTGVMVRRLLPLTIGIPLLLPLTLAIAEQFGLESSSFDKALSATVSIGVLGVAVSLVGRSTMHIDHERRELQRGLEEKVEARTREALAGEEQLRVVLDTTVTAILIIDECGVILRCNRATERIFGYPRDELVGANVSILMPEPFRSAHDDFLASYRATGEAHIIGTGREVVGRRADGRELPVELDVNEVWTHGKRRFVGLLHDISQRKEAQAALALRTAELEQSNAELEAFSYSVSHDLRAPLRSIDGFSALLDGEYSALLDERGRDHLRRVRAAAQRMGVLIDDLLELARVTRCPLRRVPVDLSALAEEILEGLRDRDPTREFEAKVMTGVVATGDPDLLRLVLENLLENAWKFTEGRSPARIAFTSAVEQRERVFTVTDNGAGFDPEHASRLFEPFQRLHPVEDFAGTGVGLATVCRIVARHGGEIRAEGAVGQGATFIFTLGRVREE
jgi:PAS domain S-box-containing protein